MLSTKRLLLSKPSNADFSLFSEILSCPQQTKYLPNEMPYSISQQQDYLRNRIKHWQEHGFGTFVISLQCLGPNQASKLDVKLGFIGIEYAPSSDLVDIRFALIKQHEGLGYTSEAAKAVLEFMSNHTEHRHIYGVTMPENQASKSVLIKLGMTPALGVTFYDYDDLDYYSLVLNLN